MDINLNFGQYYLLIKVIQKNEYSKKMTKFNKIIMPNKKKHYIWFEHLNSKFK